MRYFEIQGGLRVYMSNEEQDILEAAKKEKILESDLEDWQQELAHKMVSRGLLNRLEEDDAVYYEPNGLPDLWRF